MANKKLTTEEILAACRAQKSPGAEKPAETEESVPAAEEQGQQSEQAAEVGAENEPSAAPAAEAPKKTPKSTADILAAARAQGSKSAGGEAAAEKKPAAGGAAKKPKSTADILAAARAQGGKGDAAASPAAEKSSKPTAAAAKSPASAKPAGEKPSVQEMLKAVREGHKAEPQPAAESKPALPPRPQRPAPAKKGAGQGAGARRNFLKAVVATPFMVAWALLAMSSAAFALSLARFMFPNVLVEPPTKFKIGPLSDYPPGTVSTKWKAARGIWIVNTNQYDGRQLVYALKTVCTHLGCTPNWLEGEQKYKCPCHGSGFYITGINFEGPAPRPLERVGIRVAEDGMLEVDKSVKYQEEMGQWEDPASYVEVA